ncbi:BMP-binding endothelial regulator protein-like [Elysia marginata]|uniref:BMP-binding endothelial regulator protein-like n=1 Tax=Elysia marginata TaxID=1093978 RepID=A0AAV4IAA8_9GAST|nr:BMP-binding endothelial regulator protein-like [Elysia marginata]
MGQLLPPRTKEERTGRAAGGCYTQFVLMSLLMCACMQPAVGNALSGKVVACTDEGAEVDVPLVKSYPCFKCYCQRGKVECVKPRCPDLSGCHAVLFSRPEGHCCDVCKGKKKIMSC